MTWLRLEARSAERGWTAELPLREYAAWVKLLCQVKLYGEKGTIRADYFTPRVLREMRIPLRVWEAMLVAAQAGHEPAMLAQNGHLVVVNWTHYQPDPTNAERQAAYRQRNAASPLRNGSNEDGTVRDGTVRDEDARARKSRALPLPPPLPLPPLEDKPC